MINNRVLDPSSLAATSREMIAAKIACEQTAARGCAHAHAHAHERLNGLPMGSTYVHPRGSPSRVPREARDFHADGNLLPARLLPVRQENAERNRGLARASGNARRSRYASNNSAKTCRPFRSISVAEGHRGTPRDAEGRRGTPSQRQK
jgi:hypothetical protein